MRKGMWIVLLSTVFIINVVSIVFIKTSSSTELHQFMEIPFGVNKNRVYKELENIKDKGPEFTIIDASPILLEDIINFECFGLEPKQIAILISTDNFFKREKLTRIDICYPTSLPDSIDKLDAFYSDQLEKFMILYAALRAQYGDPNRAYILEMTPIITDENNPIVNELGFNVCEEMEFDQLTDEIYIQLFDDYESIQLSAVWGNIWLFCDISSTRLYNTNLCIQYRGSI